MFCLSGMIYATMCGKRMPSSFEYSPIHNPCCLHHPALFALASSPHTIANWLFLEPRHSILHLLFLPTPTNEKPVCVPVCVILHRIVEQNQYTQKRTQTSTPMCWWRTGLSIVWKRRRRIFRPATDCRPVPRTFSPISMSSEVRRRGRASRTSTATGIENRNCKNIMCEWRVICDLAIYSILWCVLLFMLVLWSSQYYS